ncbi:MAG: hypothetical protein ABIQ53_00010 [Terracoccus sp.]
MGRLGLGSGLAIAALVISGCGAVATPDPAASNRVTASAPGLASTAPSRVHGGGPQSVETPDDGSQTPPSPVFPLTISRTGGIAAFNDTITLRSDGRVNVETRSVHARTCTLERQRQRDLVAALATLHLGGTGATGIPDPGADGIGGLGGTGGSGPGSDASQIVISVVDARGRAVDLSEPSLASVLTMVTSLVSDVTLSQPSTRCTTAAATPAGS